MASGRRGEEDDRLMSVDVGAPDRDVELSVVIPALNAAATIEGQLQAFAAQEWSGEWEVIVADNGSTDDTVDIVRRANHDSPRLRHIDASDAAGASHARNCGAAAALGSSIAFCDADDVVSDGWVRAMGDALRRSPFVTGPQEHERLNPSWTWGMYGTRGALELQTFEGIFPFGPTANLGVRRDVFEAVGGFDTSLTVGEDIDVCLRLWLKGIGLVFDRDAIVHYRYRADLRSIWVQAVSYGGAAPYIANRLARAGRASPNPWAGVRRWLWLIRRLPTLGTQAGRARWVVAAGTSVGRVAGSVRSHRLVL